VGDWTGTGWQSEESQAGYDELRDAVRGCLIGMEQYFALIGNEAAQIVALDNAIRAADARLQRELQVYLDTKVIKSWPSEDLIQGQDYDIEEEPYDLHRHEYAQYGFIRLRRRPVRSIERVRIMLGRENTVFTYPEQWIRVNAAVGHLSIVPTPGAGWQGMIMQSGAYYLPYLTSGWVRDNIPQLVAVDYTVGLGGAADFGEGSDPLLADLRLQRVRLAARELLLDLSNAVAPGLNSRSISADGLSQSVSYTRGPKPLFGAHIDQIEADWKRFKQTWRESDIGIMLTAV